MLKKVLASIQRRDKTFPVKAETQHFSVCGCEIFGEIGCQHVKTDHLQSSLFFPLLSRASFQMIDFKN